MNELAPTNRPRAAHIWAAHPEGYYVEPSWCSERLFEVEGFGVDFPILDPACGLGRIVVNAIKAGYIARGTDIVKRSHSCEEEVDFLQRYHYGIPNIVCNPPFNESMKFVDIAVQVASNKVAMLLPSTWLLGDRRSRWLKTTPLRRVLFITPRPSIPPGPMIEAGIAPGGGRQDFAWLIWQRGYTGAPELGWLRREP